MPFALQQNVVQHTSSLAGASSSVVERFLAKEEVEGSNPFSRSNKPMRVIHLKDIPKEENSSTLFTAPVSIQNALTEKESDYNVSWVHFPDGVRNKFHTHSSDQVLIVTEGKGLIATENEEVEITEGDVVLVKKNEKHRHGALPGSKMTHLTITAANTSLEQLEK